MSYKEFHLNSNCKKILSILELDFHSNKYLYKQLNNHLNTFYKIGKKTISKTCFSLHLYIWLSLYKEQVNFWVLNVLWIWNTFALIFFYMFFIKNKHTNNQTLHYISSSNYPASVLPIHFFKMKIFLYKKSPANVMNNVAITLK